MNKQILAIALGSFLLFTACDKEVAQPAVEEPLFEPDFTISGNLYVHQPITLRSNYKKDTRLTWYFGDQTERTLIGTETKYSYSQPGTYKITMAAVDSIGGVVSKELTITYGAERVAGQQNWNFILRRDKYGMPLGHIPSKTFSLSFPLTIVNDSTISIPDLPQMPKRGPYVVQKAYINDSEMVYRNADITAEISLVFEKGLGGLKLIQSGHDTTFYLNGYATIFN